MSKVVDFRQHHRAECDICGKGDVGAHHLVKDDDGKWMPNRVRCMRCVTVFGDEADVREDTGVHELGHCEPSMDDDTHWLLMALMTDLVQHRERTRDDEAARLVESLGKILERHEPKPEPSA